MMVSLSISLKSTVYSLQANQLPRTCFQSLCDSWEFTGLFAGNPDGFGTAKDNSFVGHFAGTTALAALSPGGVVDGPAFLGLFSSSMLKYQLNSDTEVHSVDNYIATAQPATLDLRTQLTQLTPTSYHSYC